MFNCGSIFFSVPGLLKAAPAVEGSRRFIYLEASNEAPDVQGEIVLAKALEDSSDYFLRYGNLDLDHFTLVGAQKGIPDYSLYEIGLPVEVGVHGGRTFVKGEVYSGSGPAADKANMFWSSLTDLVPPQRWYPSVGGKVVSRGPDRSHNGRSVAVVSKVRWFNVGFSKTPVNTAVGTVQTVPLDVFAKSLTCDGLDLCKAGLEAGYGTDSALLTGGAALRQQMVLPVSYSIYRNRLLRDLESRSASSKVLALARRGHPKAGGRLAKSVSRYFASHLGLAQSESSAWGEQFVADL